MKPRTKTVRPPDRAAVGTCGRDTMRLALTVPETLLAKLRRASPSGDPAAAALSFLLERFKQPTKEPNA